MTFIHNYITVVLDLVAVDVDVIVIIMFSSFRTKRSMTDKNKKKSNTT